MSLRYIQQACLSVVRPASEGSFANSMQAAAACPGLGRRNAYICPGGLQHAASAHRRRLKSTAVGQAAAGGSHELLDLDTVLSRVRQAVQGSNPLWKASANKNVRYVPSLSSTTFPCTSAVLVSSMLANTALCKALGAGLVKSSCWLVIRRAVACAACLICVL
jgi:hypothetical protein